jgi:hypothetical protein
VKCCPYCQETFHSAGYGRDHLISNRCGKVPAHAQQVTGRNKKTARKRAGWKR